jgi:hypothetical protein
VSVLLEDWMKGTWGKGNRGGREREGEEEKNKHTFPILARRKDRMRNLKRSSSVCVMMRLKFAEGSMVPVMSSTVSICVFGRRSCVSVFVVGMIEIVLVWCA